MLGERRGLTIEELVWKYYAYEVHDLQYTIVEIPFDSGSIQSIGEDLLDYLWFQDNIPKSIIS